MRLRLASVRRAFRRASRERLRDRSILGERGRFRRVPSRPGTEASPASTWCSRPDGGFRTRCPTCPRGVLGAPPVRHHPDRFAPVRAADDLRVRRAERFRSPACRTTCSATASTTTATAGSTSAAAAARAVIGELKECWLVPASQIDPRRGEPVGWCSDIFGGSVACTSARATRRALVWSGNCEGASQPFFADVCAPGDFDCDGADANSRSRGLHGAPEGRLCLALFCWARPLTHAEPPVRVEAPTARSSSVSPSRAC